jgi:HEAT repeat protein
LRDKDPRTREEAVKALTNIGSAAVPILSAALRDGDLEARAGAVSALHRIGYARLAADGGADPSISGALAAALEDQHASIRLAAVRALRELGVTDLPALVRRLTDPDQEVREWVAGSLKDLGPRSTQAVEPLIDLLGFYFSAGDEGGRQSTWVQNEAAQALLRIGQTVVPALEQKLGNPNSGLQRSNIEWVLARLKGR